jgi:hypothetical protein
MPRTFRFTLADNGRGGGPSLGLGSGPMFRSRSPWPSVLVGAISCPLVPVSHGPMRAGVVIGGPREIPDAALPVADAVPRPADVSPFQQISCTPCCSRLQRRLWLARGSRTSVGYWSR